MSTTRKRHEEEILCLKEKLDDNKKELSWKVCAHERFSLNC